MFCMTNKIKNRKIRGYEYFFTIDNKNNFIDFTYFSV